MRAVVLAGQRSPEHPLQDLSSAPAAVLTPLLGQSLLERVCVALRGSGVIEQLLLCGPAEAALASVDGSSIRALLDTPEFSWETPAGGPSASVVHALRNDAVWPTLVVAGDHALLTPTMVQEFCAAAMAHEADMVAALVPYDMVMRAYPGTRRTAVKFREQSVCGCNLFFFKSPVSVGVAQLWQEIESLRKQPWKVMSLIGVRSVAAYLAGRLSLSSALQRLGRRAGCVVGAVMLSEPEAAIDVDSPADYALAQEILRGRSQAATGDGSSV